MGNVLKSEFYKLTHSKKYCVFYGIAIVLWLATFISRMIAKTDSGWLVGLTAGGAFGWDMFVAVFAVVYILDDFKNGYLKNIYFSANKFCYVFAKFLCVLLLFLACLILSFLSELIIASFFAKGALVGKRIIDTTGKSLSVLTATYFKSFLLFVVICYAKTAVVSFFAYLVNDILYVLGGWFFYSTFLCEAFYGALKEVINAIIGLIGGATMPEDFFNKFCPYGMKIELLAPLVSWWHYLLFLACWIVLSFLGSVLIYSKRRVKV